MITRNNYESYFLDFSEGNLTQNQVKELEKFLEKNPDLKQELEGFSQMILVPDNTFVFPDKNILRKEKKNRIISILSWTIPASVAAAIVIAILIGRQIPETNSENNLAVNHIEINKQDSGKKKGVTIPSIKSKPEEAIAGNSNSNSNSNSNRNNNNQVVRNRMEEGKAVLATQSDQKKEIYVNNKVEDIIIIEKISKTFSQFNIPDSFTAREAFVMDNEKNETPEPNKSFLARAYATVMEARSVIKDPKISIRKMETDNGSYAFKIETPRREIIGQVPAIRFNNPITN